MFNTTFIKTKLFALLWFLLPILKQSLATVAVEEFTKLAYPESKRPRRSVRYDRMPSGPSTMEDADRLERERIERIKTEGEGFHDVLMVAFDIAGPSASLVHEWLHEQMPYSDRSYPSVGGDVHLDSWWVANDQRFDGSSCDSAVFVQPGRQEEARELLREHGLVL